MPPQNAPPRIPARMQRATCSGRGRPSKCVPTSSGEDEPDPVLALAADVEEPAAEREGDRERGKDQRRRGAEGLLQVAAPTPSCPVL